LTVPDAGDSGTALVPTGREMKTYGVIRSLREHGVRTLVASDVGWTPHFWSRYCDERAHVPDHTTDLTGYRDALLSLAARPDVETVVPVRECDAFVLAAHADAFAERASVVGPDAATLRRVHDRLALADAAADAGVPYADTELLSEAGDWGRRAVVKSRYNILTEEYVDGLSEDESREVNDVEFAEAGSLPDAAAARERFEHDPIVQAFVPREDKILYTALWVDGEPVASYQHRQLRSASWVGGGGVYRRSAYSQAVEDNARDLLSALDWTGFACIEYRKHADTGEWVFLEVNPRVWHSMPEAVRSGVDFPYYYWRAARGDTAGIDADYEMGVPCHTSYGELKHLLSVRSDRSPFDDPPSFAGTLARVLGSCLAAPRFDYLRRDDPRFVVGALRAFAGLDTRSKYQR
jgi:predicted ATP-grasp superfamily ATP-dependent carboligase